MTFDPSVVAFKEVLEVFSVVHDPTTRNRQGNDVGTQYRSAVFYPSAEQPEVAERVIADVTREQLYPDPIVTELAPRVDVLRSRGLSPGVIFRAFRISRIANLPLRPSREISKALPRALEKTGLN